MCIRDRSDTDIEVNSTDSFSKNDYSADSLQSSLKSLSIKDSHTELKSSLTQNAFAQLVLTASKNKEKVKSFQDSGN